MRTLPDIKAALSQRGMKARIARIADIDDSTLTRIATGDISNPGYLTIQQIDQALDTIALDDHTPAQEPA